MKENNLDDLIDALLRDTITDEDRYRLESMMEADPVIARKVLESRETYLFLQYARYQQIKTQLRKFDEKENLSVKRNPFSPWAFTGILLLVFGISCWLCLINYYRPESLARRNFECVSGAEILQGTVMNEEVLNWNLANELFDKRDFQNAASIYMMYTENPQDPFYKIASWNVLMCQLATDGPTLQWHKDFDQFISIKTNPLETKAKKLSQLLDSFFYKWVIFKPASVFSAIKPRLI